ncbi:hypothetical protein BRADI_3g58645v3 [Brachypodium distachyon]|uniref:Uncharacterized protein n=1 Tax=Brachypodium distachyon TaxID=15368 RepID=A0A2K2D5N7_BRADI|nr:hypothetical protein BRADI_3g58645v3 [Brachypodium distachyon]
MSSSAYDAGECNAKLYAGQNLTLTCSGVWHVFERFVDRVDMEIKPRS